jgi:cytochrome c biogenesis protein CcmG/thiol:disulfide interchange protein DsbE
VLWAAIAVGVVVAAVTVALATRPPAGSRQAASPLIGQPAPLAAGQTVNGVAFKPETLRGHWTVVNFFATWCVPCRREHPELVAFSRRHPTDARIVSIVFQDDPGQVKSFLADQGGDWPAVIDPNGRTALDFGVTGVPESYLVDPNGIVDARLVGGVRADALDTLLQQAKTGTPR